MDCWTIEYSNISKTILELYKAWTVGLLACWAIEYSDISKKTELLRAWTVGQKVNTALKGDYHKYYGSDHHRRSAKKNRHHIQFTFGVYYKAAEYLAE